MTLDRLSAYYIDPPYNTGKSDWSYSDRVDSPEIAEWLGRAVGKESEDLCRHDKWVCMMYPRIRLLRDFLKEDGLIFVSCDDNEQSTLHLLLAELFGRRNHVGTAIWKNATDNNPTQLANEHEYVVIYSKNKEKLPKQWTGPENETKELMLDVFAKIEAEHDSVAERAREFSKFVKKNSKSLGDLARYKLVDERGVYVARRNLENPGKNGYQYEIEHPRTKKNCAKPLWGWRFPEDRMKELLAEDRIIFGKDESKIPELKAYLKEVGFPFRSVFNIDSRKGSNDLESIFGRRDIFKNPKSVEFVSHLLSYVSKSDDIILDSFAGSGTTGQAIMQMNRHDGRKRNFILIEMDKKTSVETTAERLRRVITGYGKGGDPTKPVDGLGGGFRYCRLGVPLFNEFGDIDGAVSFPDLAAHVFFVETGTPLPSKTTEGNPYLGKNREKAVYLLFAAGQEGMPREALGNVLTPDALTALPPPPEGFEGNRVVYAEGTTVSADRLKAEGVVFKQIPYQIAGV
ncbi:site-specific DNA-methyltransferase [Mesorhizobium sp. 1B3]|uniref:site-specific DNA-methyltransferase n=1 Tax=Mesorhizobium sp. 1B3 TaxID=3243599 RepID=UPI003D98B4D4